MRSLGSIKPVIYDVNSECANALKKLNKSIRRVSQSQAPEITLILSPLHFSPMPFYYVFYVFFYIHMYLSYQINNFMFVCLCNCLYAVGLCV